jgi:hypothetical protein
MTASTPQPSRPATAGSAANRPSCTGLADESLPDERADTRDGDRLVLPVDRPAVGKTHLSVGLARAAGYAGYRTYFTTAADLAARCHRAAIEGRWATTMRFYAGRFCS